MRLTYNLPRGLTYAPYLLDMIEGNHVLIAGTVGAGKSVLENSIIYALLCTRYPGATSDASGAQLVLIDPKKVELKGYKDLPHVLMYADNIPDIEKTLNLVRKMIDRRFETMQRKRQRKSTEPPVYVFIDELVDIVTSKRGKDIVRILADSASVSRAANVFFVCLTQSPSRVIIPAQFKLLFNCRCALRCNNAIESRQIIDTDEATQLPKHGLGIVCQDLEKYKIKVPMYSDFELDQITRFWTRQHPIINKLIRLSNNY